MKKFVVLLLAAAILAPASAYAYFPPIQPVQNLGGPDPFPVPPVGGSGEPGTPDPGDRPVATPEPTSIALGLIGIAAAVGARMRKKTSA